MFNHDEEYWPFLRGGSFYSSVFSPSFLMITTLVGMSIADALFVAKHYAESDAHRSFTGFVAAIALGIFFGGLCIHRLRTKQVLRTHKTDEAVLKQMTLLLIWATSGFCVLANLLLYPIL